MIFLKHIFNSKLSIITFLVLPAVIILIIIAWVYILFFNNAPANPEVTNTSSTIQTSIVLETQNSNLTTSSKFESLGSKISFDDLEKPKSTLQSQSSTVALTSPVASTPELDATEIGSLLNRVELLDNNDDKGLDDQILEN